MESHHSLAEDSNRHMCKSIIISLLLFLAPKKAKITAINGDSEVRPGDRMWFICYAVAAVKYQFFKDGVAWSNFTRFNYKGFGYLTETDQGEYSCKGQNAAGESVMSDPITLTLSKL